jgi:hypothetical protein
MNCGTHPLLPTSPLFYAMIIPSGNHSNQGKNQEHRSLRFVKIQYPQTLGQKWLRKSRAIRQLSSGGIYPHVTHFQTWIPRHQFGFRKAHSTVQQCHRLTDIINKASDDRQYCSAVFLDVSQAFDKVWYQGLLLKIKQTLPSGYFKLLKSYL